MNEIWDYDDIQFLPSTNVLEGGHFTVLIVVKWVSVLTISQPLTINQKRSMDDIMTWNRFEAITVYDKILDISP